MDVSSHNDEKQRTRARAEQSILLATNADLVPEMPHVHGFTDRPIPFGHTSEASEKETLGVWINSSFTNVPFCKARSTFSQYLGLHLGVKESRKPKKRMSGGWHARNTSLSFDRAG